MMTRFPPSKYYIMGLFIFNNLFTLSHLDKSAGSLLKTHKIADKSVPWCNRLVSPANRMGKELFTDICKIIYISRIIRVLTWIPVAPRISLLSFQMILHYHYKLQIDNFVTKSVHFHKCHKRTTFAIEYHDLLYEKPLRNLRICLSQIYYR